MGRLLSFLYTEMRAMIPCAFESDYAGMVIRMELFVEIYNAFAYLESETELLTLPEETAVPSVDDIRDTMYWFVSDYSENAYREKMCTLVDPDYDFAVRIVMDSDLNDLSYLPVWGICVARDRGDGAVSECTARGTHSAHGGHIHRGIPSGICQGAH